MSRGASQKEYFGIFWHRISGRIGNRERLYAECPLVGNDLIGNIVGGCPRETGSGYSGSAGLGERGGVLVHHYAGSYVAVDRNTGDRPRSGADRTSFQNDEAGAAFSFSASFSGQ